MIRVASWCLWLAWVVQYAVKYLKISRNEKASFTDALTYEIKVIQKHSIETLNSATKEGLNMITLRGKLKKDDIANSKNRDYNRRVSIRDKLLIKEVQEMEQTLPKTCQVTFKDPHRLHEFILLIMPDEGYWIGGHFYFQIYITEEYNMAPPAVKCLTKLWHPNINEDGDVCLSILRQSSIDEMGWAPTRKLKDVVWGLNSLFTDLLNFDDPLNRDAADLYTKDKESFRSKVKDYVMQYANR